jgi:heme exporter protein B
LVKDAIRNLRKDLIVEFRSRFALNISIAFAVIATVAISLTAGGVPFPPRVQAILLWIIIFFSAMNGLSHIFVREEDRATSLFLRLTVPSDAVFTSKYIFNQIFMLTISAVVAPLYIFFLQVHIVHIPYFIATILIGGISISASTTILAAMTAKAGGKGSLFTIVSFPILLPVLWIAISSTNAALEAPVPRYGNLFFLLAFSGFISVISLLLFRSVWLDE